MHEGVHCCVNAAILDCDLWISDFYQHEGDEVLNYLTVYDTVLYSKTIKGLRFTKD